MPIIAHCPECGGTDIRERNVAYADLCITAWRSDGNGGLMPSEWDFDADADWDTDDTAAPYVCYAFNNGAWCAWAGALSDLVIEDDPASTTPCAQGGEE